MTLKVKKNDIKIGLLQCDHVLKEHIEIAGGDYSEIFSNAIIQSLVRLGIKSVVKFITFSVIDCEFPESPKNCDAWIISGSKSSVFDKSEWITFLKNFIKEIYKLRIPLIGICFGHQLIALALGGQVIRCNKWIIGKQLVTFTENNWINIKKIILYGVHEYKVSIPPINALVIGSTKHVKIASYIIPPNIFCTQYHFEINTNYLKRIIESRKEVIGKEESMRVINSLDKECEKEIKLFADEIIRNLYLNQSLQILN